MYERYCSRYKEIDQLVENKYFDALTLRSGDVFERVSDKLIKYRKRRRRTLRASREQVTSCGGMAATLTDWQRIWGVPRGISQA